MPALTHNNFLQLAHDIVKLFVFGTSRTIIPRQAGEVRVQSWRKVSSPDCLIAESLPGSRLKGRTDDIVLCIYTRHSHSPGAFHGKVVIAVGHTCTTAISPKDFWDTHLGARTSTTRPGTGGASWGRCAVYKWFTRVAKQKRDSLWDRLPWVCLLASQCRWWKPSAGRL